MNLSLEELNSVEVAEEVRLLRNQCCRCFTNHRETLTEGEQRAWYETVYSAQPSDLRPYRVWLGRNDSGEAVGYLAIAVEGGEGLVTECVAEARRGQGIGGSLLRFAVEICDEEGLVPVAEIREDNEASIRLHEKQGFHRDPNVTGDVLRYLLAP